MLPLFYSELEIIIEAEFEMVRHQMFMTCMKLLNAYHVKKKSFACRKHYIYRIPCYIRMSKRGVTIHAARIKIVRVHTPTHTYTHTIDMYTIPYQKSWPPW